MVNIGLIPGVFDMSFLGDEKERVLKKIHELSERIEASRESLSKELSNSLAEADRDFGYFRQNQPHDEQELANISERMQLRAARFESEHPKLSAVFREVSELLRGMGV